MFVRRLPRSRHEGLGFLITQTRVAPDRGRALPRDCGISLNVMTSSRCLEFSSDSPHEGDELACDSGDDDVVMFSSGREVTVAFAESHLSFPGDVLDGCGEMFLSLLDQERDTSGETVGPGGFDESSACVGVAGFGDAAEAAVIAA